MRHILTYQQADEGFVLTFTADRISGQIRTCGGFGLVWVHNSGREGVAADDRIRKGLSPKNVLLDSGEERGLMWNFWLLLKTFQWEE